MFGLRAGGLKSLGRVVNERSRNYETDLSWLTISANQASRSDRWSGRHVCKGKAHPESRVAVDYLGLGLEHPRPSLGLFDKLFWVITRRVWSAWKESLLIVTPETVVRWHRTGFRIYWRLISRVRAQVGRRATPKEVRELIFRMVADNPTWGAPRIHGEFLMLGFELSERTSPVG
jgi:hypothetical protein